MSCEVQVRFCEGVGVRFPRATRPIITGSSREVLANEVIPLITSFLQERGLELSAEKTRIVHIDDGLDFLGQNLRKYSGKLRIQPARQNVRSVLQKIRGIAKEHPTITAGNLIVRLNPIIKGWANYHRHVASKKTFGQVDNAIFTLLWRWAKRRHPKKTRWWIADKYFHRMGMRRWVFSGEVEEKKSRTRKKVWLFRASSIPIIRHVKIKGEANPYDPRWDIYFEERLGVKMVRTLRGRWQLLRLWLQQDGNCPVCSQKITKLTGWHNHHLVWRSKGGKDSAGNRVLLHPECHRQVHHHGLEVAKPRPATGDRKA
jgi:RNA-directed DNA polymerase